MKLDDREVLKLQFLLLQKKTPCSQRQDSIDLRNSFQKGIIQSTTTDSQSIIRALTTDLLPLQKKTPFKICCKLQLSKF